MAADLYPNSASLPMRLARKTSGLTAAHRALIRLLAEVCVDEFLAEEERTVPTEAGRRVQEDCPP